MSDISDAREGWDRDTATVRGRARLAILALAATAAVHVFIFGVSGWQVSLLDGVTRGAFSQPTLELSDSLYQFGAIAMLAAMLVTAILFLRWLSLAVKVAQDFQVSPPLIWTPSQAVWGFFIPFINLTRPYHVLRDLHDRLRPEGVPEPAPQPRLDGSAGYRRIDVKRAPPAAALPNASIGAWWGLYILGGLVSRGEGQMNDTTVTGLIWSRQVGLVSSAFEIAAAALAILVVRAVDGRLAERHRRLHHASDAELVDWGVEP